jgi:hypothetical protein
MPPLAKLIFSVRKAFGWATACRKTPKSSAAASSHHR